MKDHDKSVFWALTDAQAGAVTLYGEARGESREGKIAVGSVILTRVDLRNWDGKTVKEVCYMQSQFSCFLSNDPNYPVLLTIAKDFNLCMLKNRRLQECFEIFSGLLAGSILRSVHATQYLNPRAVAKIPAWVKTMKHVASIGLHEFYIEKELPGE